MELKKQNKEGRTPIFSIFTPPNLQFQKNLFYAYLVSVHIFFENIFAFLCLLLSSITQEESTGFAKIFDIRFPMDLHVLRWPERDLTIFKKMSVCLCVCLQNFVDTVTQKLMRGN